MVMGAPNVQSANTNNFQRGSGGNSKAAATSS